MLVSEMASKIFRSHASSGPCETMMHNHCSLIDRKLVYS